MNVDKEQAMPCCVSSSRLFNASGLSGITRTACCMRLILESPIATDLSEALVVERPERPIICHVS